MSKTSRIKLVIFDLSGVCFDVEEPLYLENFVREHMLESRKQKFLARYGELLLKAEVSEISGVELWNTLLRQYNVDAKPQEIIRKMIDLKISHDDVLNFAAELKKKYTVVYLTNYNKDYWDEILQRLDLTQWFSWGVVSYEIGVRKPAKEGFEFVLKKAGVKPQEAVFIDDSAKNLDEPRKIGIRTICYKNAHQLSAEFNDLK